jgi:glutathione S-transferase
MTQITIHGFAPSTYTRTARMAAIEVGADHDLSPLAYGKPEHFALHPFGKMPALTNGEDTVFETLAIVAYLDRKFGKGKLLPAESLVQNLSTISAAIDYAYQPVVHIEKNNDEQFTAAGKVFDWLESVLERGPFLSGEAIGAADLFVAPMLDYHINEVGSDHVWRDHPKLKAWFKSISKRDSFKNTAS